MKKNKTIQELRDTRIKTTFKVEIEVELPYLDNKKYLDMYIHDILEEITKKVDNKDINGHFAKTDEELGHIIEVFYGIDEEQEWNIHDLDI